jgi:Zn-dependent peptidase ImmA (M78 family)
MDAYCCAPACNASKLNIEAFAERFARDIGLEPGGDLEAVVKGLGGRITFQSFPELEATAQASIRVHDTGDFDIYVADYTTVEQDRFSIAHELGHYLLHYPLAKGPMRAERFGSERAEWEANWFAAGLLMPTASFKATFRRARGDLAEIAAHYGVSKAAARVRARSLGLID